MKIDNPFRHGRATLPRTRVRQGGGEPHGPLATAGDLRRFGDYLTFLYDGVKQARQDSLTEDEAVKGINLSKWSLSILPILHYGQVLSTAKSNIRSVYQMQWKE